MMRGMRPLTDLLKDKTENLNLGEQFQASESTLTFTLTKLKTEIKLTITKIL